MNRVPPPNAPDDSGDDRLLRRYQEANALDDARPGPALREAVLAHARSVAAARTDGVSSHGREPPSNDPSWTLRALGSLAVLGLVGLLVLQFDRGSPEEREVAFGAPPAPAVEPAPAPADKREAAAEPSLKTVPAAPRLPDVPNESPAAVRSVPVEPDPQAPPTAAPGASPIPAPMATDDHTREALADPTAPAARAQSGPAPSEAEQASAAAAREPARNAAARREATPAADGARSTAALPPLLAATVQGDAESVRRLLEAGTDVNVRDAAGRTALMLAAQRGDAALIRLLLEAGADPALRDRQGLSATDHAAQAGQAGLLAPPNTQPTGRH